MKHFFIDEESPQEILMIPIPLPTYKAISDIAAKRGMTFSQFLARALDEYIKEGNESVGPQLLMG